MGWEILWALILGFWLSAVIQAVISKEEIVEFLFGALHLIPQQRNAQIVEESIHWNYTTILNIAFLLVASVLVIRSLRTRGSAMLRMMNGSRHQATRHAMGAHSERDHHA